MRQFQQLMSQFLQTQAMVMTAHLHGTPATGLPALPAIAPAPARTLSPLSTPAAYTAPAVAMPPAEPAPAKAVSAAPPVGPQKTIPQPAAVAVAVPAQAPVARPAAIPSSATASKADVLSQLLAIVSDRTGYPEDMLDPDANIEADLGIDSIKRMEVLAAYQQLHAGTQRGAFQGAMEKLTAIKTLRETAAVLSELLAAQAEAAVA
jgi:acyl carrier protein